VAWLFLRVAGFLAPLASLEQLAPLVCDWAVLVFPEMLEDWPELFFLARLELDFLLSDVGLQVLFFAAEVDPLALRELFPVETMEATWTLDALVRLDSDFPLWAWAVW
jgi:hypothetical protein